MYLRGGLLSMGVFWKHEENYNQGGKSGGIAL